MQFFGPLLKDLFIFESKFIVLPAIADFQDIYFSPLDLGDRSHSNDEERVVVLVLPAIELVVHQGNEALLPSILLEEDLAALGALVDDLILFVNEQILVQVAQRTVNKALEIDD